MKKLNEQNSKVVHIWIIVLVICIICAVAAIIMLKYQVEGEKNPPFQIAKILLVSTADGTDSEPLEGYQWNFDLNQNNDVYIMMDKNESFRQKEVIQKITMENFNITQEPKVGTINIYRPNEQGRFPMEETYKVNGKIEYTGSKESNLANQQIANQGGTILLRFANQGVAQFQSNEENILHDGTLLTRAGVVEENLKFGISFDIIIETGSKIKYKAPIHFDFPMDKLEEQGTVTLEKQDVSDVIFKRM